MGEKERGNQSTEHCNTRCKREQKKKISVKDTSTNTIYRKLMAWNPFILSLETMRNCVKSGENQAHLQRIQKIPDTIHNKNFPSYCITFSPPAEDCSSMLLVNTFRCIRSTQQKMCTSQHYSKARTILLLRKEYLTSSTNHFSN